MNPVNGSGGESRPGPIATATALLFERLSANADGTGVHIGLPDGEQPNEHLCVWPLALLAAPQTRGASGRDPLSFRVRFLVTADAPVERIGPLLDRALATVAEDGELGLALETGDPVPWQALGLRPRAAVLVDVPAALTWPAPTVPYVRTPLQINGMALRALHGTVVGPGDVALAGMRVEALGTGVSTYTDGSGEFTLAGMLSGQPVRLRLTGKGRRLETQVETVSTEPITIHCEFEEV